MPVTPHGPPVLNVRNTRACSMYGRNMRVTSAQQERIIKMSNDAMPPRQIPMVPGAAPELIPFKVAWVLDPYDEKDRKEDRRRKQFFSMLAAISIGIGVFSILMELMR